MSPGLSPMRHYLLFGRYEMRSPHPLFDITWYSEMTPEVKAQGVDPLLHYIRLGRAKDQKPNPLFDPAWYLRRNKDVAASGIDPVQHFMQRGAAEGRDPSPEFNTRWYLEHYPDVALSGVNPLEHFLHRGRLEGREANAFEVDFSTAKPASTAKIECRKRPILRREAALFITHSPNGKLKAHVRHYLESLAREDIGITLIVAADQGISRMTSRGFTNWWMGSMSGRTRGGISLAGRMCFG